ncbi:MAG TPA: PH domain-containing protein [Acidimicrobiales bacterium]|nr:PH domain-containing protein [Acidimicrobiales bacterium]
MAFPPKLLNQDEEIVLDLRPHWWFFVGPAFWLVVAVGATLVVAILDLPDWLWLAGLAASTGTLLWLLVRLARWTTTQFVVTTERLIAREGVIAKKGKEIPLERINDITFNQTVRERLMGAGDLMIQSGGELGQQHFSNIRRPAIVQGEIYRQIEAAAARDADRIAGRREPSIPEQIEKLDELRQRGVLSQAEFDAKKAQLLDRM